MKRMLHIRSIFFALTLIIFIQVNAKIRIGKSDGITGVDLAPAKKTFTYVDLLEKVFNDNISAGIWTPPSTPATLVDYHIVSNSARIKLRVIENSKLCLPSKFSMTVNFKYRKYNKDGVYENYVNSSLTVNYDKRSGAKYKGMDVLQLENVLLLGCEIISVSNPNFKSFVIFDSEIEVDLIRKTDNIFNTFGTTPTPLVNISSVSISTSSNNPAYVGGANGIKITYNIANNKAEYAEWTDSVELQWVYFDDDQKIFDQIHNNSNAGLIDFNQGVSVVIPYFATIQSSSGTNTIQPNDYFISNIYDKGYVFFRARAIGRIVNFQGGITNIKRVESDWTESDINVVERSNTPDINNNYPIIVPSIPNIETDRFMPTFNWQYNCTYAEDGKKKELISYFDGVNRNRQSITESNTNDTKFSIVKETIYDFEGRPTIQVLPVPIQSCSLVYVPNLNKNLNNKPYSASDFDIDVSACNSETGSMSNSSGAAQYFSENNTWLSNSNLANIHQYIPTSNFNENGLYYPFTQTEYTPDNTGRISRTTQAGEEFKLGSGKETKYFYGKPSQQEIDRLFGNEIGYAAHYTKEMIKDPNGQISINFKNPSGKVIATALAGVNDETKTKSLSSVLTETEIVDNLLENSQAQIGNGYLMSAQILVEKQATYYFNYSLNPEFYQAKCGTESKYCLDCSYDVEISLTDECGVEKIQADHTPLKFTVGPKIQSEFDNTCNTQFYNYNSGQISVSSLTPGAYTIKRTIKINQNALDNYKANYLDNAACKTQADFEAEELQKYANLPCDICAMYESNKISTSAKNNYVTEKMAAYSELPSNDPMRSTKSQYYEAQFDNMMFQAEKFCKGPSPCEAYKAVLMADVSPGGIYGEKEATKVKEFEKSVFNTGSTNNTTGYLFYSYKDLDYFKNTFISLNSNSTPVSLASLNYEVFLAHWKDEYAAELIVLHPEYYQYYNCLNFQSSKETDQQIANTETYDDAVSKGYLNQVGTNTGQFHDKFLDYTSPLVTNTITNDFIDGINTNTPLYLGYGSSFTQTMNLREFAAYLVLCKDASNKPNCINDKLIALPNCEPAIKNLYWSTYKALYIAVKSKLYEKLNDNLRSNTTNAYYTSTSASSPLSLYYGGSTGMYPKHIFDKERFKSELTNRDPNNVNIVDPNFAISGCRNRCEMYADEWLAKLSKCISVFPGVTANDLRTALINVCVAGCDEKNPMGASSLPSDYNTTHPLTPALDQSFSAVLVRLGYTINNDCKASLIAFPKPYGEPFVTITDASNSCGTKVSSIYVHGGCPAVSTDCSNGNNDMVSMVNTIKKYGGGQPCSQNQICRTCQDMKDVYTSFYQSNTVSESSPSFQELLRTYFNQYLKINKTYSEYINFMRDCLGYTDNTDPNYVNPSSLTDIEVLQEFRFAYLVYKFTPTNLILANNNTNQFKQNYANFSRVNIANRFSLFSNKTSYVNVFNSINANRINNSNLLASNDKSLFSSLDKKLVNLHKFTASPAPTEIQVPIEPCACIALQTHKDNYISLHGSNNTTFTFQDYLASININSPNAEKVLEICRQAYENVNNDVPDVDDGEDIGANSGNTNTPAPTNDPFTSQSVFDGGRIQNLYLLRNNYTVSCLLCNNCTNTPPGNGTGGTIIPCLDCNFPYDPSKPGVEWNPELIKRRSFSPCNVFKHVLDSLGLTNQLKVLDYFNEGLTNNNNYAALTILYNTLTSLYNPYDDFEKLDDPNPNPFLLLEWYKRRICECFPQYGMCGNNKTAEAENDPCSSENLAANSLCSNCYVPDKKLLGIMKTLNRVSLIHSVDIQDVYCTNIQYRQNNFVKRNKAMYPKISDYYDNPVFYPSNLNNKMDLKWTGALFRPKNSEFLLVSIKDGAGFNDFIALSVNTDGDYKYSMSFIKKIVSIRPFYIYGQCGSTQHFICEAIMVYNDPKLCISKEVMVTLTGTYSKRVTRKIDCAVRDYKICTTVADRCAQMRIKMAKYNAQIAYDNYRIKLLEQEERNYIQKCLAGISIPDRESFTARHTINQYHFTLYYYDMVGNLIKTVPPQGVEPIDDNTKLEAINAFRKNPVSNAPVNQPNHNLATEYNYNTLNQLVWQNTPDAGATNMYYDALGRLILSQNARQLAKSIGENNKFSFTMYDDIGRINEVGELFLSSSDKNSLITDPLNAENLPATFANNSTKVEVTKTFYDVNPDYYTPYSLDNLRTRVSKVSYYNVFSNDLSIKPDHAIMYSYDVQGNVKQLVRYVKGLEILGQEYKVVDYRFDPISGKVESVTYQDGKVDQYIHHYKYDAENRLVKTYSSPRSELIDFTANSSYGNRGQDADYTYYFHGPLARTMLGENQVQGIDYAYTLQGWLKGVNSVALKTETDMGKDGYTSTYNSNANVAKDEFGFALNYYDGDYRQIQNIDPALGSGIYPNSWLFNGVTGTSSDLKSAQKSLYNGNISQMITAIGKLMPDGKPLASNYTYDQLNRIVVAQYYYSFLPTSNSWQSNATPITISDWQNSFTYDANGNILTQNRNGSVANLAMDNLIYHYKANTNQLAYVEDLTSNTNNYSDDIDDQKQFVLSHNLDNYDYDEIGNLITDHSEKIEKITWNLYGKIKYIKRESGSNKPDLEFEYTPDGHRAIKIVIPPDINKPKIYTYYVRDAQGNILATYEREFLKLVDYEALSYSDVNSKIISKTGINGFRMFIANQHQTNNSVKTSLESTINANSSYYNEFFTWVDLRTYLQNPDNLSKANATIESYDNWDFLQAISYYSSFNLYVDPVKDLDAAMYARKSNIYDDLLASIANNNSTLDALITYLHQNNYLTQYNNILAALGITTNGSLQANINAINDLAITNGGRTFIKNVLRTQLGYGYHYGSSGSGGGNEVLQDDQMSETFLSLNEIGYDIVYNLVTYNSTFRADLLANIPDFKSLFYTGNDDFVDNELQILGSPALINLTSVIEGLNNFDPEMLNNKTITACGGVASIINWYKMYYPYQFLFVASRISNGALISNYQTNNKCLYMPNCTSNNTSNGISFYFDKITTYFGHSVHDQIVNEYLESSNFYVDKMKVNEWHIYGSSRLGVYKTDILVASKTLHIGTDNSITYSSVENNPPILNASHFEQIIGSKNYELSNHLGNVLSVVSDKKIWCKDVEVYSNDFKTNITGWAGWSNSNNPPEMLPTISNDNNRLRVDIGQYESTAGSKFIISTLPGKLYTVYFDIELFNCLDIKLIAKTYTANNPSSDYLLNTDPQVPVINSSGSQSVTFVATSNSTQLLFVNNSYLNNTTTTYFIDNIYILRENTEQVSYFTADVISAQDYSPFGAPLAGRSYTAPNSDYRFGFNGKELDNETNGEGNAYDFGARIYDPRLGRWLSLDPLQAKYPNFTPYHYCGGNPILFVDPDGKKVYIYYKDENGQDVKEPHLFNPNEKYTGENKYLKDFYDSYEYLQTKGNADMLTDFANDEKNNLDVKQTFEKKGDAFEPNLKYNYKEADEKTQTVGTIYWNSSVGIILKNNNKVKGRLSAAMGLFHEFFHATSVKKNGIGGYLLNLLLKRENKMDNKEEEDAVDAEAEAAKKQGEGIRDNHRGKAVVMESSTSTKTSKEAKKEKKKSGESATKN